MQINVSSIVKRDGATLDVDLRVPSSEIVSTESDLILTDNVVLKGKLTNISGSLKLEGTLEAFYKVKCSRCISELDGSVKIEVCEDFINEEIVVDKEVYTYAGNLLDLRQFITDSVFLEIPVRVLCNSDCKGLCQKCGKNLNNNECSCNLEEVDVRFEKLKNFFDQ